jgi:orotidine-5'-phosphate decarboxylase
LDVDQTKIPAGVDLWEFNKTIIDVTQDLAVCYKPNIAFYECMGNQGWDLLAQTIEYIGKDHLIIADAKRGDIGNTSSQYAKTFFETYPCDAITVAPYMGSDSVKPFLEFQDKWTIVLGLTSNPGSLDFQTTLSQQGVPLYAEVISKVASWGTPENLMFVVGATRAEMLADIRKIIPDHFLLIPGVGAQGGSLDEVVRYGMNADVGLLVNASRSILYASNQKSNFAQESRKEAQAMQLAMAHYL